LRHCVFPRDRERLQAFRVIALCRDGVSLAQVKLLSHGLLPHAGLLVLAGKLKHLLLQFALLVVELLVELHDFFRKLMFEHHLLLQDLPIELLDELCLLMVSFRTDAGYVLSPLFFKRIRQTLQLFFQLLHVGLPLLFQHLRIS
jgi:hypothetical protein